MPQYLLSQQQRDALLEFLSNYPYRQVAEAIQMLAHLPLATEKPDDPEGA